jgi:GNAT superfamily N-acetyltransferase
LALRVTLRPVTAENWIQCVELRPTAEQIAHGYVEPNASSLAQAYAERWWTPLAIYAGDEMVGFVMYGRWPDQPLAPGWGKRERGVHHILRMMIDGRHQQRGYGRAALRALLERIAEEPDAIAVELDYDLANQAAARLYETAGFKPTGVRSDGEIRARLALDTVPRGFEILPATVADAEVLHALAVASKAHWGYPPEWIEAWAQWLFISPEYLLRHDAYKAVRGQRIVGWYALIIQDEVALLDHLWLAPDAIGIGVGRRLFVHAITHARANGCARMEWVSDPNAVGFYTHMGGTVIGETLADNGRQLPVMRIDLSARKVALT